MLRPTKHAHPDQTVVAAATVLLGQLRSKRVVGYDELKLSLEKALRRTPRSAEYLYAPALGLLFLLGLVEYRAAGDLFEYRGT